MKKYFYEELCSVLNENQIKLQELLKNHTTLHIGGAADYFITPSTTEEIKEILYICKKHEVPYYIMGNGSNLLISDQGYQGAIVQLGENFSTILIDEDGTVTAQAGVLLSRLASEVAKKSFTGFEFASGIPGTLGGAVTMNASAYDGEMKQCIIGATVMDQEGNRIQLNKDELELGYRSSILQKSNYILLEATMKFTLGEQSLIYQKMNDLNAQRRDKQPLEQYSAGSTFKRPVGYYAGKLIMDAGLRGYQVGEAAVSEKHCGFVINKGNATAKEFLTLIQDVTRIVEEKFDVHLETEVKFLGDFS
ncbi:MAG: murB [Herbinix sp.]|nr:murB [Herbinix sp.]